ncbi:MAG: hypothetical protein HY674_11550 [Chloroflexi bacterium]|nr:hypothetical protein [Chloroflexota bacterium]
MSRTTRPKLGSEQLARLNQALAPRHAQYDPAEKMLRTPFSSPGYHTTLKGGFVHPTRNALHYAVGLLDTGDETNRLRALDILRRVIALQDQNPASKTYGIWSWFLEEPLDKMSPPDWNWADFCGTTLLQVALDHRDWLPPELAAQVDAAIRHAARSIQRRNVGPGYTNIAIMGTYVTLVAAELYGLADLREYALARLRRFHEYTFQNGAFTEYNSPTYTVVALKELGRMLQHVQNPEARRQVQDIYRLAWEEIAQHFHPPTGQWAGPHSRCYRTLLDPDALGLIQRGTAGRVAFGADAPSLDEYRLPLPCPNELEPFFTLLEKPRELVKTFVKSDPPIVGTTYLAPSFALGSINRGDLWNQRRALVAYWGTAKQPSYLHLRFLHDGYDFAAAQFFSVQREGAVLAGINFALDGGDTHVSLDRIKSGTIQARDLRLRFEFGGTAGNADLISPADFRTPAQLRFGELRVHLEVPYAVLGKESGRWESGKEKGKAWLDVVVYSGDERAIRFTDLEQAALGITLHCSERETRPARLVATLQEGRLALNWAQLQLSLPVRPGKASELQKSFTSNRGSDGKQSR